jgi:hypothetical protein
MVCFRNISVNALHKGDDDDDDDDDNNNNNNAISKSHIIMFLVVHTIVSNGHAESIFSQQYKTLTAVKNVGLNNANYLSEI